MEYVDLKQFQSIARQQIAAGNLDQPMVDIANLVHAVVSQRSSEARVFSSPELDALCEEIGLAARAIRAPYSESQDIPPNSCLFVATELYGNGGHTRVIEDFIALSEDQTCAVIITNIHNRPEETFYVQKLLELGAKVLFCPALSISEKLFWLQNKITALNPQRIYYFIHFWDVIAVAAAMEIRRGTGYFFHHADHNLTLGVHTPGMQHIDCHTAGFSICRHGLKIAGNKYWPLSAIDHGIRSENSFFLRGALTTACSGALIKFLPALPYPVNYFRLIPKLLQQTRGFHVHFGGLTQDILAEMQASLASHGVTPDKFIYVPWVPSLWKAMSDYGVDAYLNSFPMVGGKAIIEIMGSGTPALVHQGSYPKLLSGLFIQYPEVMQWRDEAELYSILESCKRPELLQQHRLWARDHYNKHHRPEQLAALMRHTDLIHTETEKLTQSPLVPMDLQEFLFLEGSKVSG